MALAFIRFTTFNGKMSNSYFSFSNISQFHLKFASYISTKRVLSFHLNCAGQACDWPLHWALTLQRLVKVKNRI